MDEVTVGLGKQFRDFRDKICPKFQTRELPREAAARQRRRAKESCRTRGNTGTDGNPRQKNINLDIYKYHSLGDYAATIRRIGTTDSYSTTTVFVLFLPLLCYTQLVVWFISRGSLSIVHQNHDISEQIVKGSSSNSPKLSDDRLVFDGLNCGSDLRPTLWKLCLVALKSTTISESRRIAMSILVHISRRTRQILQSRYLYFNILKKYISDLRLGFHTKTQNTSSSSY